MKKILAIISIGILVFTLGTALTNAQPAVSVRCYEQCKHYLAPPFEINYYRECINDCMGLPTP